MDRKKFCGALALGITITIYEVHDCKILYNLLQCFMWNRKNYQVCLCDCMKGDGFIYSDHVCTCITDKDHMKLREESLCVCTLNLRIRAGMKLITKFIVTCF